MGWGTWEELILGGAVLRHGAFDWNVVALELRNRSLYPNIFTPEACKTKYEDLLKRYSGSDIRSWFEELRERRVAELKQELARSEDSIGSLESKIKTLEADVTSHTASPLLPNSNDTNFISKEMTKGEQSAGSFTEDIRISKSWLYERHQEADTETKPDSSVSFEQDKDHLSIKKLPEVGFGQGVTTKKRRGKRKRKDSGNISIKEGSVGDNENLRSSNVVSTGTSTKDSGNVVVKEGSVGDTSTNENLDSSNVVSKGTSNNDCSRNIEDPGIINRNGGSFHARINLMEIFESIAQKEPAVAFKHRLDCQKRAKYKKLIRKHLDMDTIRSRIIGKVIKTAKELFRDLILLVNNALVSYSTRTREYKSALSLRHLVMKEYKKHFRGLCHEVTSVFIPCNLPVKPRSVRPRPRPRPCKDEVFEKLSDAENVVPSTSNELEKPCDSDFNLSLNSLLRVKKGLKKPVKVKHELTDTGPKTSPLKQRKRVRR